MTLIVNDGGLYSTIQDLGRYGYFEQGIPTSGALDFKSHILVNTLLRNDPNCATLEMTYIGGKFTVKSSNYISVIGADMGFSINGIDMPIGKVIKCTTGDKISFGKAKEGMRAYLGVAGGFQTQSFLNSRSTHEKIGVGKPLKSGDEIYSECTHKPKENIHLKHIEEDKIIRIIKGEQFDYFNQDEIEKLLIQSFKISTQSDRMGFRLEDISIKSEKGYDILSEPTTLGSIQVPANGKPIVLMNERQTVGGYPKIATVIKADIPKLVQLQPGEPFTFLLIELEEAKHYYKTLMHLLKNDELIESVKLAKHIETDRINEHLNDKNK